MAYPEKLANRIREQFASLKKVEEKEMMGGLTFMYNGKMCVGIFKGELMCRIDPAVQPTALSKPGARLMEMGGKPMKGYIIVNESGIKSKADFEYWINLALEFNKKAKSSKKKK
jgi:TfoX/Sxy family transcriptional regulator of competence genes